MTKNATDESPATESAVAEIISTFHDVINSASVIIGGAETLHEGWEQLTRGQREALLAMVAQQSRAIKELLGELGRRSPAELHAAIETH